MDERLVGWYAEYQQLLAAEVSFELTQQLQVLCDDLKPTAIVDLGSGWSSFALRVMAPQATIWSVDTSRDWLDKTIEFCASHGGLDKTGHFVMLEEEFDKVVSTLTGSVDVVLHDMGGRQLRVEKLPMALDLVKLGGVIVLDDMHKEDLRRKVEEIIALRSEFIIARTEVEETTKDSLGRYAWTAKHVLNTSGSL